MEDREFFERLDAAIRASGKSRAAISKACGHAQPWVSIIFRRGKMPAVAEIHKLAAALGVSFADLTDSSSQVNPISTARIPLVSLAQAGAFSTDYNYEDAEYIECPSVVKKGYIAVKVRGDSMSRAIGASIFDGCICIVDTACNKDLQELDHSVVVVQDGAGNKVIKELALDFGGVWLKSWNPEFKPQKVESSEMRVIGKVVTWFFNARSHL